MARRCCHVVSELTDASATSRRYPPDTSLSRSGSVAFIFFFQAEDGIRDLTVTGVQTCALPISAKGTARVRHPSAHRLSHGVARAGGPDPGARRVVEPGRPGGRPVLRLRGRMVPGRAGSARRQRGPGATDGADPLGARRRGRVRPGVSLRTGVDRQSLGDRCAQRRGLLAADGPHGLRAMTPERFREAGRQTIDWIARYLERIERYPVLARVAPGDIRRRLPAHPPEQGEAFDAILRDLDDVILTWGTHSQFPNI